MRLGIAICTYNNSGHISDTIRSIKEQRFTDWTCVIIDNGSEDDTLQKITQTIGNDTRFRWFGKENEGPSAGRNFAYQKMPASVDYIHFLDGDDKLAPDFFEKMVAYLDVNPNVGLLGCQFDMINDDGVYIAPGHRSRYAPNRFGLPVALKDSEFRTPFDVFFSATGQGPFAVFRNSIFRKTTGYEPDFWSHEDSDIFCQMALLAEVHYLPDRLYLKRVHEHNLTRSSKNSSHSKFRDKWDFYFSNDTNVNKRIENALVYYYGIHAPLRHFKVGMLSIVDFVHTRKRHALNWCLECFGNGIDDLIFKKALKKRLQERKTKTPTLTVQP